MPPTNGVAAAATTMFQSSFQLSPNLARCTDCNCLMSNHAESCPHCGRFYRNLRQIEPITVDRTGWVWTIGWGILASGFILFIINFIIVTIVFVLLGGLALIGAAASR